MRGTYIFVFSKSTKIIFNNDKTKFFSTIIWICKQSNINASSLFHEYIWFHTTQRGTYKFIKKVFDIFSVSVPEAENATSLPYMLPPYIRTTSMVVCILVMVLGIVGNLMVCFISFWNYTLHLFYFKIFINSISKRKCFEIVEFWTVRIEKSAKTPKIENFEQYFPLFPLFTRFQFTFVRIMKRNSRH